MTSPRIVMDTNVIISGFLFGGNPTRVLDLVVEGAARGFTSLPILDEVRGVLLRPKFGLSAEQALAFVDEFHHVSRVVDPGKEVRVIAVDPADNRVLECAEAAHAEVIVSGDAHLLDLKQWGGIRIVSPTDFVREMEARRGVVRNGAKPRRP